MKYFEILSHRATRGLTKNSKNFQAPLRQVRHHFVSYPLKYCPSDFALKLPNSHSFSSYKSSFIADRTECHFLYDSLKAKCHAIFVDRCLRLLLRIRSALGESTGPFKANWKMSLPTPLKIICGRFPESSTGGNGN